MANPVILNVRTWQKLLIHAGAVGVGMAAMSAVAAINTLIGDPVGGIPTAYALAIGSGLGDGLRLLFVELRKVDPGFVPPTA